MSRVLIALPVLHRAGTEIQTLGLVRVLVRTGYEVSVCCYYEYDEPVAQEFREAGATVILLGLSRAGKRFGPGVIFALVRALGATLKRLKPAIVHVQYLAPGLMPIVAARLARVPRVMATVHIAGKTAHGLKARLLLRIAAGLCDRFLCVSMGAERFWFGSGRVYQPGDGLAGRRHATVYNGVDIEQIVAAVALLTPAAAKERFGLPGRSVIGFVGRLAAQKGLDIALRSMPAVLDRLPEAILAIAGDGPERDALASLAERLGVSGHVRWLGPLSRTDVFTFLRAVDVFIMPSRYEGFGLAAVEAMAAGLPVVASRVEGLEEIVEEGCTGFLVPAEESGHLAGAIVRLLLDPARARRMGLAGLERARALFSIELFETRMLGAYREMT